MNAWKSLKEGVEHILKLDDPPNKVALGFAIGIFISFTPFLGLHLVLAAILSWIFRTRIRVAALATLFCNPWTMPFIYGSNLIVGNKLLNGTSSINIRYLLNMVNRLGKDLLTLDYRAIKFFFHEFMYVAKPFALGTIIMGTLSALISYIIVLVVLKHLKNKKADFKL